MCVRACATEGVTAISYLGRDGFGGEVVGGGGGGDDY